MSTLAREDTWILYYFSQICMNRVVWSQDQSLCQKLHFGSHLVIFWKIYTSIYNNQSEEDKERLYYHYLHTNYSLEHLSQGWLKGGFFSNLGIANKRGGRYVQNSIIDKTYDLPYGWEIYIYKQKKHEKKSKKYWKAVKHKKERELLVERRRKMCNVQGEQYSQH